MKFRRTLDRWVAQIYWCITLTLFVPTAGAETIRVAVAANFAAPVKMIARDFEKTTGHRVVLSFGATGHFYAQIKHGAPFDILLAADEYRPRKLQTEGLGVAGTQFTYAIGKLVLWSTKPGLIDDQGQILNTNTFNKIAIANPKLSPYGVAAIAVLNNLGVASLVATKIVEGANIAQAYQFVASENATLGFVALSQVTTKNKNQQGSSWVIPANLYPPIRQDAILLLKGKNNHAAPAFLQHLRSNTVKNTISAFGYDLE